MCGWFALVTVSSIQCNTYNIITWVLILMRHITHIIYTKASIWYLTFFHIAFPFSRYFVLFLYLWVYVFDAHFYSKVSCLVHIVDCVVFQYFYSLYYEWWRTDVVSYGVNLAIFNTRNNGKKLHSLRECKIPRGEKIWIKHFQWFWTNVWNVENLFQLIES